MRAEELDYELPADRIATHPAQPRDAARLMVVYRAEDRVEHHRVRDLPRLGLLTPGDLMVVNQTRVLPAAVEAKRVRTGGRVKGLYLRTDEAGHWLMLLESRGVLAPGEIIELDERTRLTLMERVEGGQWRARYEGSEPAGAVLARLGRTPLPPYIQKARRAQHEPAIGPEDAQQYNTVYARDAGSAAAPTAGLHFTPALLEALDRVGVGRAALTLHVGPGTFAPIRAQELAQHVMHEEWFHVPAPVIEAIQQIRAEGRRIMAVGTTTVRALESLPEPVEPWPQGYTAATRLFIHPDAGFRFRFTDMLLTNFHLPRSTLLALVASLPGVRLDRLKRWYRLAIEEGYRFYSYGDAMLLV
ncbi:MAG TPA: tRNA preQ1(34) S-adenosylmethionine ribosyltransferase-isomerase QueA [Phycisphaeraceae bacterium]